MAKLWRGYLRILEKYPTATMATTTGTLMATGDSISQLAIERKGRNYDVIRSGRFLVFGVFVFGPVIRGWYFILDKMYKGTKMAPLKMVVTDQSLFAPTATGLFLSGMGVLKGETFTEIKEKFKQLFVPILISNYKIWPAAQLVNFYFMPLQHRVLFVNFVALGWNTYLAWKSEK
ncbi:hypothetical protein LOTGIDRAFT_143853 [Lottia gigantea]|uniref:Mitochondrial inner membrane protein Mpv17 n=1 Tax=Lottia gigantea TaxID=225164 RepID=V4AI59_LOTGI|nr:hypothetical protein LOTGIDRAFT_143853 [Lottia gigantea]ESO96612.1 hypothetical protein LOTGIDRAFT_143853 [Lottia gigantea]